MSARGRRRSRERYKPADLKRGIVRDGYTTPRDWTPDPYRPFAEQRATHDPRPAVVRCKHDVPWTICALCSRAKGCTS